MLITQPSKGDLIKLPQGVVAYKRTSDEGKDEMSLVFAEHIERPSIGIFIENLNDRVSKIIFQDQIRYVYSEWLFNLEEMDADQNNNDSRRDYKF